jgi:putative DNA-invertase from lambdoid prophage Rac
MKVGLYARVSTYDQHTLPMQIKTMREYVENRKWQVVFQIEDIGSGASERPKREVLLKSARRKEIDAIIVWRLDRWGRSVLDLISTLQECKELEIGFISINEALDFTTPSGRAMAGLLAVFADFEREILRERIKAGIAHAREQGRPHGRPRIEDDKIALVKTLFKKGLSKSQIAKRANIGRTSVRRLLKENENRDDIILPEYLQEEVMEKTKVKLWLRVENNSKFVRGKTKVRKTIEDFILHSYNPKKLDKDGWEYELTIHYETEEDLDDIIEDLLYEMENEADMHNCFTEADISTLDGTRSW